MSVMADHEGAHMGHPWVNLLVHPRVCPRSPSKETGRSLKPGLFKKKKKKEKKTARGNYLPSFISKCQTKE